MALEYFPFYHSYGKKTEKLTDQELGRLVRALVKFSETGETQELAGRESIAFDFISVDIQNARDAYEEKCSKNRANGANATERTRTVPTATERPQNKTKTKTKEETKTETEKVSSSPPAPSSPAPAAKPAAAGAMEMAKREFSGDLLTAVLDWLSYKKERREPYKEVGLRALFNQIRKAAETHGEAAVVEVIRNSMASGYMGITLDKLKNAKRSTVTTAANYVPPKSTKEQIDYLQKMLDEDRI